MGFKDITDGEKVAKPIAARIISSKDGEKDAVEVCFEFEEPSTGNPERLYWQGWLSDAAIERTMDVLVNVLGFNMEVAKLKGMEDKGVLNYHNEVKLVVEGEEYEGKMRPKIKWVNRIGGSGFAGLTPEITKTKLSDPRIAAAFAKAKQGDAAKSDKPAADVKEPKKKLPF